MKYKNAMLDHAVTLPGVDGAHAVYKRADKYNSNFEVIGAKMNGQTEHVSVQLLDTEEQTSIVWITTNCSQQR